MPKARGGGPEEPLQAGGQGWHPRPGAEAEGSTQGAVASRAQEDPFLSGILLSDESFFLLLFSKVGIFCLFV